MASVALASTFLALFSARHKPLAIIGRPVVPCRPIEDAGRPVARLELEAAAGATHIDDWTIV